MSKNTGTSKLINYFTLGENGDVAIAGSLDINTILQADSDTDKFLVSNTGIIKYRTGAQLLSDIGAQGALTNPVTGTGSAGQVAYWTGTNSQVGSSFLFWDNSTGRLRVNSTTANSNLTVSGSDNTDIFTILSGANSRLHVGTVTSPNNDVYIRSQNNYNLKLGTNNSDYLTILNDGNVGIGTTTPTSSFNSRLAVRNEDAANNPTLTLFKNITSESAEDIFRVQSWNGAFNTVASIKANGNATFGSTNGIVTVNRSSTSFASLFKMSTAGVENWSIGIPTLSSADWVLFNHATGISNLSFASSTGAATFSVGANRTVLISNDSVDTGYNVISLNGTRTKGSYAGIAGGGTTDDNLYLNTPSALVVQTGASFTERFRITSIGRGLFGTQTASAGASGFAANSFHVNNEIVSMGSSAGFFWENRSGGVTHSSNWYGWYTTGGVIYLYNGAANIASINTSTGAYTGLSDINKKENFEASEIGLKEVLNLKPTIYSIKNDSKKERHLGFIAQEVREYIPNAYVENGEFIGLSEMPIIAALTKAIQELKQEIDTLKN